MNIDKIINPEIWEKAFNWILLGLFLAIAGYIFRQGVLCLVGIGISLLSYPILNTKYGISKYKKEGREKQK